MRPIERLEETYFPKDIKLLEYMEEVAVLYVPDYDIDHETGEQYIYGTTALPLFIRRYNQNKLYGNFTYEDYIANEDIQNTLKGLGVDIDKFWFLLLFICHPLALHYQHLITSIKKIYLKKEQNVCIIQFIPLSLHRV